MPPSTVPAAPLSVGAVARRLGVAPATLRTWDRRYGIGPTVHATGSHRRYGPEDVARLEAMRRLTRTGVSPAEAARVALAGPPPTAPTPPSGRVRTGGGRVVALPQADPRVRGLARAALALDAATCTTLVRDAVRTQGVVGGWDGLVAPTLAGIGERWAATHEGVDAEHLLSECVIGALLADMARRRAVAPPRPVLLACAEDELHALPLYSVAAALAERGVAARILGARVPAVALADAVRRVGPAAVFVWSSLDTTGRGDQLRSLPGQRPPVAVVVGGPGWDDRLPERTERVTDLSGAVAALLAAAG